MNFIKKYIIENFLKRVLDALPANGKKTIISILILVLTGVLTAIGVDTDLGGLVQLVLDFLKRFEYTDLTTVGVGGVIVGLTHKVIKYFYGEPQSGKVQANKVESK